MNWLKGLLRTEHFSVAAGLFALTALVLLAMNIGPGRAGVKSGLVELKSGGPSTLLRRLNENDRAGAADEWLKWVYAGGQQLAGLVKRRAEERALFLTPVTVPIPAAASPGIATPAAGGASAWQRMHATMHATLRCVRGP